MDSLAPPPQPTTTDEVLESPKDYASLVDAFLIEALQNPRHRLTILRMEVDIQNFLKNFEQQFEFQHFPTSYLRLAAHRVAQHYGLQTMVQDNFLDGHKIVVRKLAESRFPVVSLSDVPVKLSESEQPEQIKIVLRPKSNKASSNDGCESGGKRSLKTVEERKEEYDRARARIFSSPISSSESLDLLPHAPFDGKNVCLSRDGNEVSRSSVSDSENALYTKDGGTSSRVAIFRDREKDRSDPDYDRSYRRYVKNVPVSQNFSLTPFAMEKLQSMYVQYDPVFPHMGQMPGTRALPSYRSPVMSPYCAMGLNQTSADAVYVQWPSNAMMYAQSHGQFRNTVFQGPLCQQPLSFDYYQNH